MSENIINNLPPELLLAQHGVMIDPKLEGAERVAAIKQEYEALKAKLAVAEQTLAAKQEASVEKLTPEQVDRRDQRMERGNFTENDVFVHIDDTGRRYANTKFAGDVLTPEYFQAQGKDKQAALLEARAPEGIRFSRDGRPDFTPFAAHQIMASNLTGDNKFDIKTANEAADITPDEWKNKWSKTHVWHHVEDGKTMQLVPKALHDLVRHAGGNLSIKQGVEIAPAYQQEMAGAYEKQAGYQQEKTAARDVTPSVAAEPLMAKPPEIQKSPAYTPHIKDGDLRTQFSAGDGKGPLGHADFKKEEIGRMLNDPDVKTINGHEVWRYKYNYDKAEYEALQRGATPEQAQLVASERTQQVMARVEMAQERAELRQQPYIREVNTHFDKLGQLRDARVQGLEARAKLENREYRGPAPKPPTERQFEARTGAHIFTNYAKLDIYAKRYGYSPKAYLEKKTGLDRSIAEYKHRERQTHERSLSGFTREPSIDRSFGPELSR